MKEPGIRSVTKSKTAPLEIGHLADFPRLNPNPVLELSATGEIIYGNDATAAMARELGPVNPAQMLPADTAAMVRDCLASGTPKLGAETQIGWRVFSWSFFPVKLTQTVHCYGSDVTAHKQDQETLSLRNAALEAAANAIVITDASGNILWVNDAFTALTGYTAQEVLGQNPHLLKSGRHDEAFYRNLWQTISSGQVWTGELTNRRKDGSLYTEEMTITPVRSANGTIGRYIAIKQDVSKRKQAEEALRASQQITEGVLNAIPVRVFWKDKNLVYLGCNAIFARDAGFAHPQDIIGKDDYQMAWRQQAECYRADDREVIESGTSKFLIEEPQTTPQGNTITLLSSKIPLRGCKGEITGVLGTYVDITARKQAEEKVKLFRTLIERSNDGIYVADPATGRFLDANESAFHALGYTRDELLAMTVFDVTAGVDRATFEAGNTKIEKTGHTILEVLHRRKDGTTYPVEVGLSFVTLDRKYLVAIVRDTTERKQMEVEMENVHKQLVESSRLAGMADLATNLLHNVGNVLNSVNISANVIAGSARMSKVSSLARVVVLLQEHAHDLGEFLTQDPGGRQVPVHLARLSEHLAAEQVKIVGELESLRHNIEHIKDIVAMQQNYAMVGGVKEVTDLATLVEDSLRLNGDAFRRHGVAVVREFEAVPALKVEKHKILQILVNLVRNAKYACDESGRADRRLTVRLANGEGRVKISVLDNGIGIPPENLTRIFNYGFTTRNHGHGFGLHSSALAAKEMGGSLTVQSGGPGQGATFTLELPGPTRENCHE